MSLLFRPSEPSDAPQLSSLFENSLGMPAGSPGLNLRVLNWKYWEPRGDWGAPRSYVLTKEGMIVAHAGIWPLVLHSEGSEVRGIQMIDWAASHDSAGAGVALMRRLAGMFEFVYSIGGSHMTRKLLPAAGFRVSTTAWRAARPIRPIHQLWSHQTKNWTLIPRLFRNYYWSSRPRGKQNSRWMAHQISPRQLLVPGTSLPYVLRPYEFFEYLGRCPVAKFTLWRILESEKPVGILSLAVVKNQARVAGVWLQNRSEEGWGNAYNLAQQTARTMSGVFEVVAGGSKGISTEAAVGAGLRVRSELPVFVLEAKNKPSLPRDFEFQLVDDDSVFRDSGPNDYLT